MFRAIWPFSFCSWGSLKGLADANSTEFEPETPHPVIALIDEWQDADGTVQKRDANSDLGGTMRLGLFSVEYM